MLIACEIGLSKIVWTSHVNDFPQPYIPLFKCTVDCISEPWSYAETDGDKKEKKKKKSKHKQERLVFK